MKIRNRIKAWKQDTLCAVVALGGAFWLKWGVCALLLAAALIFGGVPFVMIGLGGLLGCICAVMLDGFTEFRRENGTFMPGCAFMGLLAFAMANMAFHLPGKWAVILGCLVSSGLLLALILRCLDRETGMNIQVGIWLSTVAGALLLCFLYAGPYAGVVGLASFVLAVGLYVRLLIVLRDGAETGLRAAWHLALGIGVAVLTGAAFNKLGVIPAGGAAFGGFVVGLLVAAVFSPVKRFTNWVVCRLDEEKEPEW
jgi:hypothetical protein